MSFVSCIVIMSGCLLFLDFVSDAVYVEMKYGDGFVILLIVCEWVGGVLLVDIMF